MPRIRGRKCTKHVRSRENCQLQRRASEGWGTLEDDAKQNILRVWRHEFHTNLQLFRCYSLNLGWFSFNLLHFQNILFKFRCGVGIFLVSSLKRSHQHRHGACQVSEPGLAKMLRGCSYYCWWKKSQTTIWDVNDGINYLFNWLAGFLPSTVGPSRVSLTLREILLRTLGINSHESVFTCTARILCGSAKKDKKRHEHNHDMLQRGDSKKPFCMHL